MTLLSDLVDGAAGSDVAVETLLRKVKVIAARAEIDDLAEWVEHELVGYPEGADLPAYRGPFPAEVHGHFGGPFNSGIQNAPIPAVCFPEWVQEGNLFKIAFPQSIAEIGQLAGAESGLRAEWPADAVALTNSMIQRGEMTLYEGMGLQQAWRRVPTSRLGAIVDTVRTRILDLALSLEQVAPEAGQIGTSVPQSQIKNIVTNVYGSANVAVSSTNVEQNSVLPEKGDLDALFALLRDAGLDEQEIDALRSALERDEKAGESVSKETGFGANVTRWLGRIASRSASAGGQVGVAASGDLVARALASYFGLG